MRTRGMPPCVQALRRSLATLDGRARGALRGAQNLKVWRQAMIAPEGRCRLLPDGGEARLLPSRKVSRSRSSTSRTIRSACGRCSRARSTASIRRPPAAGGGRARRRCEIRRLPLARPFPMWSWRAPASARWRSSRASPIAASAPGTPPDIVARASLAAFKVPDHGRQVRGRRRRPRPLQCAARRRRRCGGGGERIPPLPSSKSLNVLAEARQVLPQCDPLLHADERQDAGARGATTRSVPDRARSRRSATRWRTATRPSS